MNSRRSNRFETARARAPGPRFSAAAAGTATAATASAAATAAGSLMAVLGLAAAPLAARADVTVQQQTSMNVAGIKIDVSSTQRTSGDKQRSDSTTRCHGLLALVCHNVQSGEIVRLDKQLQWQLEPKKKTYLERPFPTPAQRAQAQAQMQAAIDEMKKCPTARPQNTAQSGPDTSHCQMSPPVVNVKRSDDHASILGHDARKASVVLSQSCTNTQTGDVCEFDYGFDSWLTSDEIAGSDERNTFTKNYLTAQGLDPSNPQLQSAMQQFMAPYMGQLKQLKEHAGDLQGHPLRTTFYVAFGGPHCGQAKQDQQQQASDNDSGGGGLGGLASKALGSGFSGLFHHGSKSSDSDASSHSTSGPDSGGAGGASGAQQPLVQVISLTTETTAVDTSSIPSDQFEIPTGWHLQQPQPEKDKAQQLSCPTTGG